MITQGGPHTINFFVEDNAGNNVQDTTNFIMEYGPSKPTINGPRSGTANTDLTYSFRSTEPTGDQVSYYIDWDDGTTTDWTSYVDSGTSITETHQWSSEGSYTIKAKAKDSKGAESESEELTVGISKSRSAYRPYLFRYLFEQYPALQKILNLLL